MKKNLTARTVKALQPSAKPYEVVDTELKGFLLRVQPSGKMTYYLSYRLPNGRRNRYKIGVHGTITATQARDVAKIKAGKVAHGIDIQAEKKAEKAAANRATVSTLRGFLDNRYHSWVTSERKTGSLTIARIRYNFADLLDTPLSELDTWKLDKWRFQQTKNGKATSTVNRDIVALKAALSKAVEWEIVDTHPLAKLKLKKIDDRPKVRYLTTEEEKRLRKALLDRETQTRTERVTANTWRRERGYPEFPDLANMDIVDHLRPLVILAMNTGLRRGELFHLTWANVNFHTRTLVVEGANAKSGNTRHVPLNDEALRILKKWKSQSKTTDLVFPGKDGKPLDNIQTSWQSTLRLAKITAFRFHDLRHHFASKLVMASVDLNTVRELLGHADLKMTLRYAHLEPEHKAEAVSRLLHSNQEKRAQ